MPERNDISSIGAGMQGICHLFGKFSGVLG